MEEEYDLVQVGVQENIDLAKRLVLNRLLQVCQLKRVLWGVLSVSIV